MSTLSAMRAVERARRPAPNSAMNIVALMARTNCRTRRRPPRASAATSDALWLQQSSMDLPASLAPPGGTSPWSVPSRDLPGHSFGARGGDRRQTRDAVQRDQSVVGARPVPAKRVAARTTNDRAQDGCDDDRVVDVADRGDEVGNKVERHREIGEQ